MTNLFSSALYDPPCLLDPFLQWMRHSSKDLGTQAGDKEEDDTEEEDRFRMRRRRNRGISSMAEFSLSRSPRSPPGVRPLQPSQTERDISSMSVNQQGRFREKKNWENFLINMHFIVSG